MIDKVENLLDAGVIDPAKVTRNGLLNSVSIAGIMLTTQVSRRRGGGEEGRREEVGEGGGLGKEEGWERRRGGEWGVAEEGGRGGRGPSKLEWSESGSEQ